MSFPSATEVALEFLHSPVAAMLVSDQSQARGSYPGTGTGLFTALGMVGLGLKSGCQVLF